MAPAVVAAWTAVAAAAVGTYATVASSQAQRSMSNFNADRMKESAESANKAAASDAWKQSLIDEADMASNRVYFNTHGVRIDSGTPLSTLGEQAGKRAVNVAAIRMRGANEYSNLMNQSELQQQQGQVTANAGYVQGTATLLSGASGAYRDYNSYILGKS